MFIIIAGGGLISDGLVKELIQDGHEILMIDKCKDCVERIMDNFGSLVILGDACDPAVLTRAGIQRADMIVANTEQDEDNLVICQIALKRFRVPFTMARVNNPANDDIFKKLGINATVNMSGEIVHRIKEQIYQKKAFSTLTQEDGVQVVKFRLLSDSPAIGNSLEELIISTKCILNGIIREGEIIKLEPSTVFQVGDVIIALGKKKSLDELLSLFIPEK